MTHGPQPWPLVKAMGVPTAVTTSGHRQRTPGPLGRSGPPHTRASLPGLLRALAGGPPLQMRLLPSAGREELCQAPRRC